MATEVGVTEFALSWTHNSSDVAENFTINCTLFTSTVEADPEPISTLMPDLEFGSADPASAMMPDEDSNSTFVHSISGLEEHTTYTCSISARNTFGTGPASETITIMTGSRGKAELSPVATVPQIYL